MRAILGLALSAGAGLGLSGLMMASSGAAAAPKPAAPTAAELVAARQAGYRLLGADFVGLKAAIARGDDVKTLAFPAGAIAAWGKALPGLFPAGATTPDSKALPAVWSDRAGFEAAAAKLATEAGKLAELAKAGDSAGFAAQFQAVGGACKGCHDKYRAEEKK